jgi:branched-chain amino acid transport system permease protein
VSKSDFPPTALWAARIIVLAIFIALPFVYSQKYVLHILSLAMIFAIAALALQLLLGFTGLLSIGQAAFLGIGAYTSALITTTLKAPFELGFLAAGVVAGIASLTLVPITRLRGVYLAVATLGFTIIVHLVILNEEWLTDGSFGMMNIPMPSLGPWNFEEETSTYHLCLAVLVVTFIALHRLMPSRFGRALQAIMLDEDAARANGINVTYYKSQAFVVAAVITGFAGSLFAHHAQYLNPNDFTFWKSIEILIMVAVGGIGSFAGAITGAVVVTLLPEYLRAVDEYRMVIFGALLIAFMGLGHRGLAGLSATVAMRLLRLRPRADATATQHAKADAIGTPRWSRR